MACFGFYLVLTKKGIIFWENTKIKDTDVIIPNQKNREDLGLCYLQFKQPHAPPTLRNPLNQKHVRQNTHSLFKASFLHLLTVRKCIAFLTTSFPVEQQSKKSFFVSLMQAEEEIHDKRKNNNRTRKPCRM